MFCTEKIKYVYKKVKTVMHTM